MTQPTAEPVTVSDSHPRPGGLWSPERLALWAAGLVAAACVVFYFRITLPWVMFPADILMWSETDFVGQIIKLRTGTPIYTAPEHSNALIYTPGAATVTYALSRLVGLAPSPSSFRIVQLAFVVIATLFATLSCVKLRRLAYGRNTGPYPLSWLAITVLFLFLAATSPFVNRFVHVLHTDALALLISMAAWWLLLRYVEKPTWARLIPLALIPAVGYAVKQFLVSWIGVSGVVLLVMGIRDWRANVARWLGYGALGVGAFLGTIGLFVMIWGENFLFWTFDVMGGRNHITLGGEYSIALLRSADHLIRAWMEIAVGVVGGWLVLRGDRVRRVGPLFVGWLALVGSEALSSGAGWNVLYHFGPGVLIGATWLFAALPDAWPRPDGDHGWNAIPGGRLVRPAFAALALVTVCVALQSVPNRNPQHPRWFPGRRPTPELFAYIQQIEREFEGYDPQKVLLDVGNWVYLPSGVVARDRAISMADQPASDMYDNFEIFLERIRTHTYDKILVRNLHNPTFLYDWSTWNPPSGVRSALLKYYEEVRTIPEVDGLGGYVMFAGPVSVLIPRASPEPSPNPSD